MSGEEVYFEFGLPELLMLALVLVLVYSVAEAIGAVARRQQAHLARGRAAAESAEDPAEDSEIESA